MRPGTQRAGRAGPGRIAAPFHGTVTVLVAEGQRVAAGTTIATIEAMKMEAAIRAPRDGRVARLAVRGTRAVDGGDLVLELS